MDDSREIVTSFLLAGAVYLFAIGSLGLVLNLIEWVSNV